MEIKIVSKYSSIDSSIINEIILSLGEEIEIIPQNPLTVTRGLDPTVLVSLVGTGGTILGALLSGFFQLLKQKGANTITIISKGGAQISFPANYSVEKLEAAKKLVMELDSGIEKIVLK